jgi:hypothetical protein
LRRSRFLARRFSQEPTISLFNARKIGFLGQGHFARESLAMGSIKHVSLFEQSHGAPWPTIEKLPTFGSTSDFLASLRHQCISFGHRRRLMNLRQFSMWVWSGFADLRVQIDATQF